jgi:cation diffusion facilitator family transporter
MDRIKTEQTALKWSAIGSLFMGILGIVFALLTRSEAILLDGFFSFIGFIMGLFTLKVARLVLQPDDAKFQFGYAFFEPFFNTIRGLVILLVCGFAVTSGVVAILQGGRQLSLGYALVYTAIAMVGCFLLAVVQRKKAKKTESPLLDLDAKNWMIDGVMSCVVAAAFLAAYLLQGSKWAFIIPYVDPGLVVLMVAFMLHIPLRTIRDGVGELLQVAPPPELEDAVRARLEHAIQDYPAEKNIIRMTKVGRYFYVLLYLIVSAQTDMQNVALMDSLREKAHGEIKDLHPALVMDVVFTQDEKWAK